MTPYHESNSLEEAGMIRSVHPFIIFFAWSITHPAKLADSAREVVLHGAYIVSDRSVLSM